MPQPADWYQDAGCPEPLPGFPDCPNGQTDGYGGTTIDGSPGASFLFSREFTYGAPSNPCDAPERDGVRFTVPNPVPATKTITVPSLPLRTTAAAISPDERGLVGAINRERGRLGRAPLEISNSLSRAADAIVTYHSEKQIALDHCAVSGPGIRALDFGFPSRFVGENLYGGPGCSPSYCNAAAAFDAWMKSTPHRENQLDAQYGVIGVAGVGGYWALNLARPCSAAYARCELTGDTGDASLLPPLPEDYGGPGGENPDGSDGEGDLRSPGLRLLALTRRGRLVRLRLRVRAGARGTVRLKVRRCVRRRRTGRAGRWRCNRRHRLRIRHTRKGTVHRFRVRLPRKGRWAFKPYFRGRGEWADKSLRPSYVRLR